MDATLFIDKSLVITLIRVLLGVVMIYYGYPKIKDLRGNADVFANQMGFRPGWIWGTSVALLEFFGGIGVLLGILAPLAAGLFGVQMLIGTIWKIKIGKGFKEYSYDLQLLVMSLAIVAFGSGAYSFANVLF